MQCSRGIAPPLRERETLFLKKFMFRGEATKISFQTFVGDFNLAICLWVISWTHIQFGSSEEKEFSPKMTCESCVVVWDNGRRDSMKTEYLVMKICVTEEAVYGFLRAQKWLYWESWSTTTKITVFCPDLGSPSMKSIEISVQILIGMGKGSSNPGRSVFSPLWH